ncbi:MAG TPA: hypothetical protein VHI52_10575, partial [Verrucomicrobiae bacterium]|nr:hypothetical protein [Verrucomicrobiae bacterium]
LVPATDAELEGRRCHRVEQWDVRQDHFVYATKTEWWIDAESLLPRQIVQYSPNGCQIVAFEYSHLNESLPESAFQPPSDSGENAHPLFFTKDPETGETRFLKISDGANGRMSGRLGWHGASGTTSSGLN